MGWGKKNKIINGARYYDVHIQAQLVVTGIRAKTFGRMDEGMSSLISTLLRRLEWNEAVRFRSFHSNLFVSDLRIQKVDKRPEQIIAQLTFAAGPRSSSLGQRYRHVGSDCP